MASFGAVSGQGLVVCSVAALTDAVGDVESGFVVFAADAGEHGVFFRRGSGRFSGLQVNIMRDFSFKAGGSYAVSRDFGRGLGRFAAGWTQFEMAVCRAAT